MIEYAEYNGWTNRETWMVNLWLTNEQHSYEVLQHIIKSSETVNERAQQLENAVRDNVACHGGESSMWRDLLGIGFSRVNWYEIVECNRE